MKTILVVYTNTALTAKQISDKKMQKYVFRTEEDFKEGGTMNSLCMLQNVMRNKVIYGLLLKVYGAKSV